jgi:nucleoside-diphosphate-sugar epimerase
MKILITGANGFIGNSLTRAMIDNSFAVICAVRNLSSNIQSMSDSIELHQIGCIDRNTNWQHALNGVDTIVHCAGRAHVMKEEAVDPLAIYREVNVHGTVRLANQAAIAGVKRFVFLSSIKVNGEITPDGVPFSELSLPEPSDAYGLSKLEAESALFKISSLTGMEVVVIRPSLVYGPGIKGNFLNLIRLVQSGLPLPFGALNNKRSFVALENLISFIVLCSNRILSPLAANNVFLVSDNEDTSTTNLIRKIADAGQFSCRLLPIPESILRASAAIIGKHDISQRLFGNLQVDTMKAITLLGWKPEINMDEQLRKIFINPKHFHDII